MASRPRLLFLSHCLPYPAHSGVRSRTLNILKQLQLEFDVTLLAFSRRNHQPDRRSRERAHVALSMLLEHAGRPVPIAGEHSSLRRIWDHLRSVASWAPYTRFEYASREYADQLNVAVRSRQYDLVHVDSLDLFGWLGDLPAVPTTCTHHNIESQLLRLHAPWVTPRVLSPYLTLQAKLLEGVERVWAPRFSANVMTSDADAQRLRALAPDATTIVVPNGADTAYFTPSAQELATGGRIAFVGATHMFPNRDAVEYLLRDIWPGIRRAFGGASLSLIGGGPAPRMAEYGGIPGVTALGHVADVRPHVAEAQCCVVPIRIGGGTRLKILDAWAMGRAVVSTSVGCEGLEAIDGHNILIRDDAVSFADAVVQVLENADQRSQLAANGRATVESLYSWESVGRRIRSAYEDLLGIATPVA